MSHKEEKAESRVDDPLITLQPIFTSKLNPITTKKDVKRSSKRRLLGEEVEPSQLDVSLPLIFTSMFDPSTTKKKTELQLALENGHEMLFKTEKAVRSQHKVSMKELSAEYEKLIENTRDIIKKISACDESDDTRRIVNGLNVSLNNEKTFLEDIRGVSRNVSRISRESFKSDHISKYELPETEVVSKHAVLEIPMKCLDVIITMRKAHAESILKTIRYVQMFGDHVSAEAKWEVGDDNLADFEKVIRRIYGLKLDLVNVILPAYKMYESNEETLHLYLRWVMCDINDFLETYCVDYRYDPGEYKFTHTSILHLWSRSHHEVMLEIMSAIHGILKEILEAEDQRDNRHDYGQSAQLQSQHLKNVEHHGSQHDVRGSDSQILMKWKKTKENLMLVENHHHAVGESYERLMQRHSTLIFKLHHYHHDRDVMAEEDQQYWRQMENLSTQHEQCVQQIWSKELLGEISSSFPSEHHAGTVNVHDKNKHIVDILIDAHETQPNLNELEICSEDIYWDISKHCLTNIHLSNRMPTLHTLTLRVHGSVDRLSDLLGVLTIVCPNLSLIHIECSSFIEVNFHEALQLRSWYNQTRLKTLQLGVRYSLKYFSELLLLVSCLYPNLKELDVKSDCVFVVNSSTNGSIYKTKPKLAGVEKTSIKSNSTCNIKELLELLSSSCQNLSEVNVACSEIDTVRISPRLQGKMKCINSLELLTITSWEEKVSENDVIPLARVLCPHLTDIQIMGDVCTLRRKPRAMSCAKGDSWFLTMQIHFIYT